MLVQWCASPSKIFSRATRKQKGREPDASKFSKKKDEKKSPGDSTLPKWMRNVANEVNATVVSEEFTAKALRAYVGRYKTPWKGKAERQAKKEEDEYTNLYHGKFIKLTDYAGDIEVDTRTPAFSYPAGEDEEFETLGPVRGGLDPILKSYKWSSKSEAAKTRWADPSYREKVLTARRKSQQTRSPKLPIQRRTPLNSGTKIEEIKAPALKDLLKILDHELSTQQALEVIQKDITSNIKRSEAMKRRFGSPLEWMDERLKEGEIFRAKLNNEDYKKERQAERSEVAKKRYAARKVKQKKTDLKMVLNPTKSVSKAKKSSTESKQKENLEDLRKESRNYKDGHSVLPIDTVFFKREPGDL